MARGIVLAVDIGGTKTACATIDADGAMIAIDTLPTPQVPAPEALATILQLAQRLPGARDVTACGLDLPAVVDGRSVVWASEAIADWQGLAVADLVSDELGVPCLIEFDGYAAAIGEAWVGAARGYQDALVVIVGTGIGAGVILGGQLLRAADTIAGGIGWARLAYGVDLGPRLEDIASGSAILRRANLVGSYASTAAVFDAAGSGDDVAAKILREAHVALAAGLGTAASLIAPQIIVLGGGVGSRRDVVDAVKALFPEATQPTVARRTKVVASSLGPLSSLFGAARLAHELRQAGS